MPTHPRVVLLGIPTRGVTLANRLAGNVAEYSGVEVAHGALDITLYRDDLMQKPPRPLENTSIPPGGINDALVILVDDVLYSGRSVRSALDALRDQGRPRVVQLAVLLDRGHRELPLRADYVGKNVPTSRSESVHACCGRWVHSYRRSRRAAATPVAAVEEHRELNGPRPARSRSASSTERTERPEYSASWTRIIPARRRFRRPGST